jgi:hypothetical protein
VGTVIGWTPADARDALIALLRKNGLLSSGQAVAPGAAENASEDASEDAASGR